MSTRSPRNDARSLAEWVTLFVSSIVLASVFGFLVLRIMRRTEERVPLSLRVLTEETQKAGDQYSVPIEIFNGGNRTLSHLHLQATFTEASKKPVVVEMELDYVAEKGRRKLYLLLDQDPRSASVEVRPIYYRLD